MPSYPKEKTKLILCILGVISLCLGVAGIVLPILPTTPFLLLASFLFYKSSKKLHNWLESNRVFGNYIRCYRKYKAVNRRTKIISIVLLWVTLGISIYLVDVLYVRILLSVVGVGVTVHLIQIKTLERVLSSKEKAKDIVTKIPLESDYGRRVLNMDSIIVKEYFGRLAGGWDDSTECSPEKLRRIADCCEIKPSQRVLDIACGTGVMFPFLLDKNPSFLLGVDICDEMARKASSKFSDDRLQVITQDFLLLNQRDFDFAICYNAYPHFFDKAAFAKKIRDVLKKDGRFVIAHGSGRAYINAVHIKRAADVSITLNSAKEEEVWFVPYFEIDISVDDSEIYIISGTKK